MFIFFNEMIGFANKDHVGVIQQTTLNREGTYASISSVLLRAHNGQLFKDVVDQTVDEG